MSKQDISDLVCESSVFTDVRFKSDRQQPAKDLTMRNFQANNVRFRDCQFDNYHHRGSICSRTGGHSRPGGVDTGIRHVGRY